MIQHRLKRLNDKKLQIQECKVQEVKATDASSGDTDNSGTSGNESSRSGNECSKRSNSEDDTDIKPSYDPEPMVEVPYTEYNVFAVETQHTKQLEFLNDTSLMEKVGSNTIPDSSDMCNNEFEDDQNTNDHEDEQRKSAHEVSNDIRDRCRSALHHKEVELEKYISHLENRLDKPITNEITVLVKDHFMPLAEKPKANASEFEKLLKEEMFDDLQFVQSLEKELDALQSDKNEFANKYDLLLQECLSKDIMCAILRSFDNIDEQTELQCLYLEKKSRNANEQLKNDKVWKQKESSSFRDQNEQYFFIQDLKAQIQDMNIAISELKKLIEMMKGKGVDTILKKPSILGKPLKNQPVIRQPTTFKSERSSFSKHRFASQVVEKNDFTKPVTPHSWPQARQSVFAKSYHVNAPGASRNSKKHVLFQSPQESVGLNDMVHNYYLEEAKKNAQLQKDKALNSKPSVITLARLLNTASGSKLKPRNYNQQSRNWPPSISSRVTNKDFHIAEKYRNQKPFLKSKDLAYPTCKKCIYTANHDACILKYLSEVNSRTSAQKKDAQSHKTTKRYIPVEKKSDYKNHDRQIPIRQRFPLNKSSAVYVKITPPRSGLTWKPTGRIFTYVVLRWIPTWKSVETCKNEWKHVLLKLLFVQNFLLYVQNNRVILFSIHSEDGNPSRVNIKQALRFRQRCSNHIQAESDSLPHAHARSTKIKA
ncbi:hypothetical protein Tco_0164449 [Tanacetum coccineum]